MPVGEAVGLDRHAIADDALRREPPTVDDRRDIFDDGAHAAFGGHRSANVRLSLDGHR